MSLTMAQILNLLTFTLMSFAWGIGAVLSVELVRDMYHVLSHRSRWLYQHFHKWHHEAFRVDFSVVSEELYRQSHWYHDVPESVLMFVFFCLFSGFAYAFFPTSETLVGTLYGTYYTGRSVIWAVARGLGYQWADATDPNHKAVQFLAPPAKWTVNPASHWRHHFDNPRAYFCGTYTFLDKLLGTAVSLQGKTIAVTGASGALGQALSRNLIDSGARVIALTSSRTQPIILEVKGKPLALETVFWQIGHEQDLAEVLARTDILILNHGMNVHHQRTEQAVQQSFEVNTWSSYRLLELFLSTVRANRAIAEKEVWAVTSEAEVAPAQSPLYELSKRTFGELVTLKRLDAPCVIRKILLGGFRSKMSPKAPMSANWVAKQILDLVKRDTRNVIISYRLWIYVVYPIREFLLSSYFKAHSRKSVEDIATIDMIPMHEEA